MPRNSIFNWRDGLGWLVLSGGGDFQADITLDIDASVLSRTVSEHPLAYIWTASDIERGDRYLDYVKELGGRTGFLIDVMHEDDATIDSQLTEAGIIVVGDGPQFSRLHNGLRGAAVEAMQQAHAEGATIYVQGEAAKLMGTWLSQNDDQLTPGFGWLERAIISPGYNHQQAKKLQAHLQALADSYGVGINEGSALALGPYGEVELWGEQEVTVLLGKNLAPA